MTNKTETKFLQVNLNKNQHATENILQLAVDLHIDVIAIQEPWLIPTNQPNFVFSDTRSIHHPSFTQIFPKHNPQLRPRTMVYVSKNMISIIKPSPNAPYDPDMQVLEITDGDGFIQFINIYNQKSQTTDRGKTINHFLYKSTVHHKAIILGDFNLHHPLWEPHATASSDSENLVEWTDKHELILMNSPGCGTFFRSHMKRPTTIDLTFVSSTLTSRFNDWQVIEEAGSDHFGILFTLNHEGKNTNELIRQDIFNFKKADWNKFSSNLRKITTHNQKLYPDTNNTALSLEHSV